MPFQIAARMILELGAELISSDAVALYELMKNAVDAGSETTSVHVQVVLLRSDYDAALEAVSARVAVATVQANIRDKIVDSAPKTARDRFVHALQRHDGDRITFRRALKRAYREENWIKVIDAGCGMSAEALKRDFLTIGTRSRRKLKVSRLGRPLEAGQNLLGDKGVGRLSAMRLGDRLSVVTTECGEPSWNELHIDWNRFSHGSDAKLGDIAVAPEPGEEKDDPAVSGTVVTVSALRSDWDVGIFRKLVEEQFSRIVDPLPTDAFDGSAASIPDPEKLFDFRFNGSVQEIRGVPDWLLKEAHARVTASFHYDPSGAPVLTGSIDYRLRNKSTVFRSIETELTSLIDPIADRAVRASPRVLRELGPFQVSFYWYNRRILAEVQTRVGKLKRQTVVDAVNAWSGGLMVFRNGYRINPYGSGDDDWLELDKKALGARGYKVNRAQIIGKVSLTSRNHKLIEQTNREGLADNEHKQALVGMLRHIMITEFRTFITRVDESRRVSERTTVENLDARITRTKSATERSVLELMRLVPSEKTRLLDLKKLLGELGGLMDEARRLSREYEDDRSKFVQLAGIGLMVEFILHEIGRATGRALDVMSDIDPARLGKGDASAVRTLADQLRTLRKRVDNLDPLSTSRRQVAESLDITAVVQQVVEGRGAQFERHGIEVTVVGISRQWPAKAIRGMLIGILENLLENSVYWLKMATRVDRHLRPSITLEIDPFSQELRVSDNGPGVDVDRAEEIFEPFVTAKPPGQGRGLGLYIAREMARSNNWSLAMADDQEVRPGRLNTFVIHMGSGT